MKPTTIIPEHVASALTYAYEINNDIINNLPHKQIVLLVDMGYVNTNFTVIRYTPVFFLY